MSETVIKIENLKKQYKLGAIGGQTLSAELQSWWAKKRGKEDPNAKIGQDTSRFGESFYALDGINLEIKKGEALGIIGGNGAGKSTLLKILSRVTAPTEGDVWINGRIASMLEVGTGFHAELTGRENIYMNGAILGMTKKEVDEKIESIIDFSECRQFIDTPVKRYSSGMYVKLAFAVASHLDADIMIMDEVLAVGDMAFQKKCLTKMGEDAHGGKTVLYVSHNMSTIRNLCNRCIVLNQGKKIFEGDTEDAIDLYTNSNIDIDEAYINNQDINRKGALGTFGRINSVEFDGLKKLYFNNIDDVKFKIEIESDNDLSKLYIGVVYLYSDTTIVGFDYIKIDDMRKNERKHLRLKTNFHEFPAGNYRMRFNLFQCGESGIWIGSIDQTKDIRFNILDDGRYIQWRRDWFGNVSFKQLMEEK